MENEKYVITIDGPDCTGKSTLWNKANSWNKNIQVRGIVSNIAYAIKYERNVEELIELYNQNPVNYVVYLLNPINDKKLEMLYNRIRTTMIYDNDRIVKELKDASETWKDYDYFIKAIDTLKQYYKGKIEIIYSKNNDLDDFKESIKDFTIKSITDFYNDKGMYDEKGIRILKTTPERFEAEAKEVSEFKYIVFINNVDKEEIMSNLYEGLDELHKSMYDALLEYTDEEYEYIYDELTNFTVDELVEYLDSYEFDVELEYNTQIDGSMDCKIPLKDFCEQDCRCLEDYVYDDCYLMDEVTDYIRDDVGNNDIELYANRVR